MEKIYRVPSKYQHRVVVLKPKWKLWLRFALAIIPPMVITFILTPYIPDRWDPWFTILFLDGWMFFTLMLPVFKDMIRWNRHVGRADSGTYWILSDDTLTVVDEETNKPSQVIHRSEVIRILAWPKELGIFTNNSRTVVIPRIVEGIDELYDHLNEWMTIEPYKDLFSDLSPKQRREVQMEIATSLVQIVSTVSNFFFWKSLPTIVLSSIAIASSLLVIVFKYKRVQRAGTNEYLKYSYRHMAVILVTILKLVVVLSLKL